MKDYPDLRVAVQDVAIISASGLRQSMIDLTIRGPDLDKLQQYSEQIANWMKSEKGFLDVDTSLSLRKPELRVNIDRERASDLGIPVQAIASTLNVLVGGEPVSQVQGIRRAVRRLAAGRFVLPRKTGNHRPADDSVAEGRTGATGQHRPTRSGQRPGHHRPLRHAAAGGSHCQLGTGICPPAKPWRKSTNMSRP